MWKSQVCHFHLLSDYFIYCASVQSDTQICLVSFFCLFILLYVVNSNICVKSLRKCISKANVVGCKPVKKPSSVFAYSLLLWRSHQGHTLWGFKCHRIPFRHWNVCVGVTFVVSLKVAHLWNCYHSESTCRFCFRKQRFPHRTIICCWWWKGNILCYTVVTVNKKEQFCFCQHRI